jgi:hypothetical protein
VDSDADQLQYGERFALIRIGDLFGGFVHHHPSAGEDV